MACGNLVLVRQCMHVGIYALSVFRFAKKEILESNQKLDCKIEYDEQENPVDFTIYDKSGYVLRAKEIVSRIGIRKNPEKFKTENTEMDAESKPLKLELQKCIKEAYEETYRNSGRKLLFSEHIDRLSVKPLVKEITRSERFQFIKKYLHTSNQELSKLIREQFKVVKDKLCVTELVQEFSPLATPSVREVSRQ